MDTTILVEKHIMDGMQLLTNLFQYSWKISVAFWNKNEFSNEWKLYLGTPILKKEGSRKIYLQLTKRIMEMRPKLSIDIDDIVLINSNDPVAKEIRNKLVHDSLVQETTKTLFISGNEKINGESICYIIDNIKQ